MSASPSTFEDDSSSVSSGTSHNFFSSLPRALGLGNSRDLQSLVESPQPMLDSLRPSSHPTTFSFSAHHRPSNELPAPSNEAFDTQSFASDEPDVTLNSSNPPTRRPKTFTAASVAQLSSVSTDVPIKRKRGRPPKSKAEPVDQEVVLRKKDRRRDKNREAARRSREKKKQKVEGLEDQIMNLEEENRRLRDLVQKLQEQQKSIRKSMGQFSPSSTSQLSGASYSEFQSSSEQKTVDTVVPSPGSLDSVSEGDDCDSAKSSSSVAGVDVCMGTSEMSNTQGMNSIRDSAAEVEFAPVPQLFVSSLPAPLTPAMPTCFTPSFSDFSTSIVTEQAPEGDLFAQPQAASYSQPLAVSSPVNLDLYFDFLPQDLPYSLCVDPLLPM